MRFFYLSFFVAILLTFAGCASTPPTEDISEVVLSGHTGLLGVSFTITFRGDGAARCECNFYRLDKNNKPNLEYTKPLCGELYRSNSSAFVEAKTEYKDTYLKGEFVGNIKQEQFEQMAQLINKNGFFSMKDKYIEEGVTDAPSDFTKVVYAGKTKGVSDNMGKGGEKLSEIKGAIYKAAKETKWESARK